MKRHAGILSSASPQSMLSSSPVPQDPVRVSAQKIHINRLVLESIADKRCSDHIFRSDLLNTRNLLRHYGGKNCGLSKLLHKLPVIAAEPQPRHALFFWRPGNPGPAGRQDCTQALDYSHCRSICGWNMYSGHGGLFTKPLSPSGNLF